MENVAVLCRRFFTTLLDDGGGDCGRRPSFSRGRTPATESGMESSAMFQHHSFRFRSSTALLMLLFLFLFPFPILPGCGGQSETAGEAE